MDKTKLKKMLPTYIFNIFELVFIIWIGMLLNISIYKIACILLLFSNVYLRKKCKDSYTIDVLVLSMLMILYTYEVVYIYTVIITLLAVSIQLLIQKLHQRKSKILKRVKIENNKIPIGFYMCVSNIIILLATNFAIFYR